jgi:hypothetical protein
MARRSTRTLRPRFQCRGLQASEISRVVIDFIDGRPNLNTGMLRRILVIACGVLAAVVLVDLATIQALGKGEA